MHVKKTRGAFGAALWGASKLKPWKQDREFLCDLKNIEDNEDFCLWWLGQSGVLIVWRGSRLLIDPYLSDFLTRTYEGTGTPHERLTERVIDPSKLVALTW